MSDDLVLEMRPSPRSSSAGTGSNTADHRTGAGMDEDIPLELPIDGVLDLHTFQAREVKDLIPDYLAACQERGILQVRIIHGKGTGTLRRTVHAILARLPGVASFGLAKEDAGGWGATMVTLVPKARGRERLP